jgi:hypothetical protein
MLGVWASYWGYWMLMLLGGMRRLGSWSQACSGEGIVEEEDLLDFCLRYDSSMELGSRYYLMAK